MRRLLAGLALALALAAAAVRCDKDVYLGAAPVPDGGDAAVGDAGADVTGD